jgi:hypothetical protein
MKPTDRDRVFVADFSTEGAGLGEANVMRLAWRSAADDAGQCGDELAMLPVAQANGLGRHAAMARAGGPGQDDRSFGDDVYRSGERIFKRSVGSFRRRRLRVFLING